MASRLRSRVHYGLAVLVLAAGAIGLKAAKARGLLTVLKKPLPIRKPLGDLNRDSLGPFEVLSVRKLGSDIVQELGTKEYINWILLDTRLKKQALASVSLSVTYYTDVLDQVPHVPEECYFQGAFSPAGDETLTMKMDHLGEEIPVRRLSFFPLREFVKKTYVYYTIRVNDRFYTNRQSVRLRMASPLDTHLYYSKVEVCFQNVPAMKLDGLDRRAKELFELVISELDKSHWPAKGTEHRGIPAGDDLSRADAEQGTGTALFGLSGRDAFRFTAPTILSERGGGLRSTRIATSSTGRNGVSDRDVFGETHNLV